ncbi:hypothetical protein M7I_2470 [Glarea lozoyensis 74030]|uniref:Uncharacterized protein n=1 Tax=Glarea lozoyensis (strain ATCC 74030 / MF5533) TaxID=1104152 RepID=H0EIV4_GLAL7|nr:hypothetical protein M7I_2470 [Glarea lozoyensis 74030]
MEILTATKLLSLLMLSFTNVCQGDKFLPEMPTKGELNQICNKEGKREEAAPWVGIRAVYDSMEKTGRITIAGNSCADLGTERAFVGKVCNDNKYKIYPDRANFLFNTEEQGNF